MKKYLPYIVLGVIGLLVLVVYLKGRTGTTTGLQSVTLSQAPSDASVQASSQQEQSRLAGLTSTLGALVQGFSQTQQAAVEGTTAVKVAQVGATAQQAALQYQANLQAQVVALQQEALRNEFAIQNRQLGNENTKTWLSSIPAIGGFLASIF